MNNRFITINNKKVGDCEPVFIIAEVGINHNGSLTEAKKLISAAKQSGADAVKLQSYITEKRVPLNSPIYENLKSCELNFDEQSELFLFASDIEIMLFSKLSDLPNNIFDL